MIHLATLLTGLIFGLGLAVSGMTDPQKVLGFLDITGNWNPSLMLVLGGAVGTGLIGFHLILKRHQPLLADQFHLPGQTSITPSLLIGSAIFGIGWGISGYCPGPAVALLANPNWETLVFLPGLLLGHCLQRWVATFAVSR
ncbi:MAG: YeeE/YedE family protein [Marinospirillum sp.]|uniref:DUF6691 family protein n=1 Tax=Marinospirillum sp. TaxID=2183934 RepID=UPI001A090742|nr:DUF6691 family protein [Marinospirillum sp.]MBE0507921.1 YeeE/YedE family protein [Marinospirillum sp.]